MVFIRLGGMVQSCTTPCRPFLEDERASSEKDLYKVNEHTQVEGR